MPKSKRIRMGRSSASNNPTRRFLWHWRQLLEQVSSSLQLTKKPLELSIQPPFNQLDNLETSNILDGCLFLEYEVTQERLRQARLSFNVALAIAALSAAIGFAGIGLLLSGKLSEGALATTTGLTSSLVSRRCLWLAKEANDRLDKTASEQFKREQLTDRSTPSNEDRS